MSLFQWMILVLAAAVIAALFGLPRLTSGAASMSRVLFTAFLIVAAFLFLLSLPEVIFF